VVVGYTGSTSTPINQQAMQLMAGCPQACPTLPLQAARAPCSAHIPGTCEEPVTCYTQNILKTPCLCVAHQSNVPQGLTGTTQHLSQQQHHRMPVANFPKPSTVPLDLGPLRRPSIPTQVLVQPSKSTHAVQSCRDETCRPRTAPQPTYTPHPTWQQDPSPTRHCGVRRVHRLLLMRSCNQCS
jgi:hypothetical protein